MFTWTDSLLYFIMQQKIRELNKLLKDYLHSQQIHHATDDRFVQTYYEISLSQPMKESRLRKIISRNNEQSQLKIDLKKYVMDQWRAIFPLVTQLRFQSLVFNQIVGIGQQIKSIHLKGLKNLDLSHCRIQTIQFLPNMNLNVLKQLNLSNNAINCLKPLRKVNAFKIQTLDISNNCLISLLPLQQLKTKKNMNKIIIEQYGHQDNMCEQIQVLCKLQAKSIRKLKIQSLQRVSKNIFLPLKKHRFTSLYYQ